MTKTLKQADAEAWRVVDGWTAGAALTGWIPGSSFFLTGADIVMINQVAAAYEVETFEMDNVTATLAGAVGSAIAGGAITEVVGLIPIIGWAVKSAAMAGKARVIGEAVIHYFRDRSPLNPDAGYDPNSIYDDDDN